MRDEIDSRRRTVCKTLPALLVGTAAMTSTASAESTPSDTVVDPDRTGTYTGTVDRVVDGAHVVVLLERGGETVDQVVVSSAEYPDLEERDAALVSLEDGQVLDVRRLPF